MKSRALKNSLYLLCLWSVCLAWCSVASAQNPVSWSISGGGKSVKQGEKFNAQIAAQIAGGWHVYSVTQGGGGPIPTRISVTGGAAFKAAGAARGPNPHTAFDPNFQINTETYEGAASFNVPVSVAADAAAGNQELTVAVRFQACNDSVCLPPKTVNLTAPFTVVAAALSATPTPKTTPTPTPTASPVTVGETSPTPTDVNSNATVTATDNNGSNNATANQAGANTTNPADNNANGDSALNRSSLFGYLLGAFLAGLFALLTPCVFPMIPITVSYFTSHASNERRSAVRDAVIYALGIILTFTALGVLLALLFGAAGINKLASNVIVNLAIAGIFLAFALSLFGAFNLQVPSGVLTRLDSFSRNKDTGRIIGLLLMGLTFSLTSFTCTVPFVGTVLVAAAGGELLWPVLGMLAFSTAFALPFFILALAPQLVSQLPRAGGWLNSVKVVMGLLEIAAAMKFLSNADLVRGWGIFTREVVLAVWVAAILLIALYLLGKFQLTHDSPTDRIGVPRLMVALIAFAFGFYLLTGLFGKRLSGWVEAQLPPLTQAAQAQFAGNAKPGGEYTANGELSWIENDYKGALAKATAENRPVFIDFTGYTCTNCRWMEANMFTRENIKTELAKYVRVRLYTDGEGALYEQQQAMQQTTYGTVALPFYATVDGAGKPLVNFSGMTRDENSFVNFLKNGQAKLVAAN